jgi:predicted nucleic acid-binding Zn ribbon protein
VLGDWVAVCLACGFAQRYFESSEDELPGACPQCAGELRSRCPACAARFSSAFAVECEVCGAELRPAEQFGIPIRRSS